MFLEYRPLHLSVGAKPAENGCVPSAVFVAFQIDAWREYHRYYGAESRDVRQ